MVLPADTQVIKFAPKPFKDLWDETRIAIKSDFFSETMNGIVDDYCLEKFILRHQAFLLGINADKIF
jgi:hypothetical protein